jgi:hypothetical protein
MKVVAKIGDRELKRGDVVRHLTTGEEFKYYGARRDDAGFWLVMQGREFSYQGPTHWVPSVFGATIHADKVA